MLTQPPALLQRAWRWQRWGAPGIEQTDAREYYSMLELARIYETVRAFHSAPNVVELAKHDPDGWRLMSDLRMEFCE